MATKLGMINQALVRIGAEPVSSLSAAGAQALVASTLYDTIVQRLLAQTPWTFALAGQRLAEVTNVSYKVYERYEHVYQLPTDCVRVLGLESLVRFQIAQHQLHTDDDAPHLVYVANVSPSYFAEYFADLVVHELAASFAISITDTTSRAEIYQAYARRMKPRAMAIDAQQTPPEVFNLMQVYARGTHNPMQS